MVELRFRESLAGLLVVTLPGFGETCLGDGNFPGRPRQVHRHQLHVAAHVGVRACIAQRIEHQTEFEEGGASVAPGEVEGFAVCSSNFATATWCLQRYFKSFRLNRCQAGHVQPSTPRTR